MKAHDYLLPEDITLLKILAGIPEELQDGHYADKVAEMFKKVKIHLVRMDIYMRIGLILTGAFGAYSLGANNIANVIKRIRLIAHLVPVSCQLCSVYIKHLPVELHGRCPPLDSGKIQPDSDLIEPSTPANFS